MSCTKEQWSLIFYVILPVGFFCLLYLINWIEDKRRSMMIKKWYDSK